MGTKNAIINDHRQGQEVKHFHKELPHGWRTIFADTLIIKPIHLSITGTYEIKISQSTSLGHSARFVITSNQMNSTYNKEIS